MTTSIKGSEGVCRKVKNGKGNTNTIYEDQCINGDGMLIDSQVLSPIIYVSIYILLCS